jgi:hypothetical protein
MGTKICTSCFVEKTLEIEFYKHSAMADGYLNKCKECVKDRVRTHRDKNIEYFRKYDKKRYLEQPHRKEEARQSYENWVLKNPNGPTVTSREWRKRNPEKYKAQNAVNNAIARGKLKRKPCKICGEKAQAHHEDYSKPLEVTWLCQIHHAELHRIKRL